MNNLQAFFNRKLRALTPFEPHLMEFCATLSKELLASDKMARFPDIAALAFWLRRSHLEELKTVFFSFMGKGISLAPRGTAFHIAPANVETMFVYSWILSLLVGNANIVRLPTKEGEGLTFLFDEIQKTLHLNQFQPIQETTCFVSYGHEEQITSEISSKVDVRLIWGGDETIQTIRKIPLKISGKEIVFVDRYAYCALDAEAILRGSDQERHQMTKNLYNDIFWYDQQACSSPRTLFWIGSEENIAAASALVYDLLQKHIEQRAYTLPLGAILQKETYIYSQAIDLSIKNVKRFSNEFTLLMLERFNVKCREHCGLGLLYHIPIKHLLDIVEDVNDKDQTLTYYGVSNPALQEFMQALNGKGLNRIVPIGQALSFDYFWDGYNLLLELTKSIEII